MSITLEDVLALEALEARLRTLLPDLYRDTYEDVQPVSMGSAGLKFDADGRVAWNQIWATFCDLAMAGGPPHRGSLLEPAPEESIAADPEKFRGVANEIGRGIGLVTGLQVQLPSTDNSPGESTTPCWIGVRCPSIAMAAWLVRAIVMENVMARHEGDMLYLPAGPDFRLAKEIKNVITVIAKTCHYWTDHMPPDQQAAVDAMIAHPAIGTELLEPALPADIRRNPDAYRKAVDAISREITNRTGQVCFAHRYMGWIGVECRSVRAAIWLMRAMVVDSILARREEAVLFLPVVFPSTSDAPTSRLLRSFEHATRLLALKNVTWCSPPKIP